MLGLCIPHVEGGRRALVVCMNSTPPCCHDVSLVIGSSLSCSNKPIINKQILMTLHNLATRLVTQVAVVSICQTRAVLRAVHVMVL